MEVILHAWKDPAFKEKLLSDPKEALRKLGLEVPSDISCRVIEEAPRTWTLVIPSRPDNLKELGEEELKRLAVARAHPLHPLASHMEESLWQLFSHRFWPSPHDD
jgi:hypothetical protein